MIESEYLVEAKLAIFEAPEDNSPQKSSTIEKSFYEELTESKQLGHLTWKNIGQDELRSKKLYLLNKAVNDYIKKYGPSEIVKVCTFNKKKFTEEEEILSKQLLSGYFLNRSRKIDTNIIVLTLDNENGVKDTGRYLFTEDCPSEGSIRFVRNPYGMSEEKFYKLVGIKMPEVIRPTPLNYKDNIVGTTRVNEEEAKRRFVVVTHKFLSRSLSTVDFFAMCANLLNYYNFNKQDEPKKWNWDPELLELIGNCVGIRLEDKKAIDEITKKLKSDPLINKYY